MHQSSSGPQSASTSQPPNESPVGFTLIWLAIGAIFALMIGASAGILEWLGGEKIPIAIAMGAGAFGGTLGLVILIIGLLSRQRP